MTSPRQQLRYYPTASALYSTALCSQILNYSFAMNDDSCFEELFEPLSLRIDQHSVEDYIEVISNRNVSASRSGMVIRSKEHSGAVKPEGTRTSSFNHRCNIMKNGGCFLFSFMRNSMGKKHGKYGSDGLLPKRPRRGEDRRPKGCFCFCCT